MMLYTVHSIASSPYTVTSGVACCIAVAINKITTLTHTK